MTTSKTPIPHASQYQPEAPINDFETTDKGGKAEYYLNSDILQFQSDFQFETSEEETVAPKEVVKKRPADKTDKKINLPSFDSKRKLLAKKKDSLLV